MEGTRTYLLLQPELLANVMVIVGIQNRGNGRRRVTGLNSAIVVTGVEALQIEASLGLRIPHPDVVTTNGRQHSKPILEEPGSRVLGIVSWDWNIVSNGEDLLSTTPDTAAAIHALGVTAESDLNGHVGAGNLPRVGIVEPWIRARKLGYARLTQEDIIGLTPRAATRRGRSVAGTCRNDTSNRTPTQGSRM